MVLSILSAVGGCVQVIKTLYEYYDQHRKNKALLDILEGFSQNLEVSIERLKVREQMLVGTENPALDSIEKDFTNAKRWLLANDKNLRSIWTTLQAADKLRDLDDRLTKAFASKMAIALFEALQDTRHATQKIQTSVDGMATNLEAVCREATRDGIHEAIVALKEEAYQATGGGMGRDKGFRNGEAEKIISQLVDQLSAAERLKEDEERGAFAATPEYTPSASTSSSSLPGPSTVPYRSSSTPAVPYTPAPSLHSRSLSTSSAFRPKPSSIFAPSSSRSDDEEDSIFTRKDATTAGGSVTSVGTSLRSSSLGSGAAPRERERKDKIPVGSIVFVSKDPFDQKDLVDPVLASDGLIHDRWTLIEGVHKNMRDPSEPLIIIGDVVQLREAIFTSFPTRRTECLERRQAYREETLDLYKTCPPNQLPQLINRLSHILLWEPTSISLRVRRGIALYRIRDLEAAENDLSDAVRLSRRGKDGEEEKEEPDLDALRARALVREEMHDYTLASLDLDLILSLSPHDILARSLRATLRANAGNLKGAQEDLAATNEAITKELAYRSRLGDSDCDLEYLARGWAYVSLRDFQAAVGDFSYSLGLKAHPEPYTLACRGLSLIQHELATGSLATESLTSGLLDLDTSLQLNRHFGEELLLTQEKGEVPKGRGARWSSGAEVPVLSEEKGAGGGGMVGRQAFACFFLRGSARFAMNDFEAALEDFEAGMRLRPSVVKDTGAFRAALAEMRVESGDREGAATDFDHAIALDPSKRFVYGRQREEYGL